MKERWCVIVVPGFVRRPRGAILNLLTENLLCAETLPLKETTATVRDGLVRTLVPTEGYEDLASFGTLDVSEAHWSDLIPNDAEMKPLSRMFRGLSLFSYWVLDTRMWRAFLADSWFIAAGSALSASALVLWLAAAIVAVLAWAGDLSGGSYVASLIGAVLPVSWSSLIHQHEHLVDVSSQVFTVVLPLLPVMVMIDLARLGQAYLEDEGSRDGVGLRSAIRLRVQDALIAARRQSYDQIILVAHSFGTLPAIDLLADWKSKADLAKLRIVTLGSPAGLFSFKSDWVRDQVDLAIGNRPAGGWADFRLHGDLWSTGLQCARNKSRPIGTVMIGREGSLIAGIDGAVHMGYFHKTEVLSAILDPAPQGKPSQQP